jgi:hypothetical protein
MLLFLPQNFNKQKKSLDRLEKVCLVINQNLCVSNYCKQTTEEDAKNNQPCPAEFCQLSLVVKKGAL